LYRGDRVADIWIIAVLELRGGFLSSQYGGSDMHQLHIGNVLDIHGSFAVNDVFPMRRGPVFLCWRFCMLELLGGHICQRNRLFGLCDMRRGIVRNLRIEHLHGMYDGFLPGVYRLLELLELRDRNLLCLGLYELCELLCRHVPSKHWLVKLCRL